MASKRHYGKRHRGGLRRLDGGGFTEISDQEIAILKQLIEYDGAGPTAEAIGVSQLSLFRVAAGFSARMRREVLDRFRAFFAEGE